MKTIWKFTLERTDKQYVDRMPATAKVIHVGMQDGKITLWAIVNPNDVTLPRCYRIVGTGNPFPDADKWAHIGTVFDGPFVWHVFE